jgi:hypothetical protein
MIKIKYDMKIINPDLHVMTVDSFDLINRVYENGKKMLCHSRYSGPESIIFNEKTRCVKAIKGNVRDTTNLILVPNEVECTEKDFEITRKKYWTKGVCEQKDIIDIHNVVQIKNAMQYNYIYCNLFNITNQYPINHNQYFN